MSYDFSDTFYRYIIECTKGFVPENGIEPIMQGERLKACKPTLQDEELKDKLYQNGLAMKYVGEFETIKFQSRHEGMIVRLTQEELMDNFKMTW